MEYEWFPYLFYNLSIDPEKSLSPPDPDKDQYVFWRRQNEGYYELSNTLAYSRICVPQRQEVLHAEPPLMQINLPAFLHPKIKCIHQMF